VVTLIRFRKAGKKMQRYIDLVFCYVVFRNGSRHRGKTTLLENGIKRTTLQARVREKLQRFGQMLSGLRRRVSLRNRIQDRARRHEPFFFPGDLDGKFHRELYFSAAGHISTPLSGSEQQFLWAICDHFLVDCQ
jgi:hypothetical protein